MGLVDNLFSSKKATHERAYGRGVKASRNEGFTDKVMHGIGDVGGSVIPHPTSTEHKSYEAGYHSGKRRRGGRSRSSYSGSSSSTDSPNWFLRIIALGILGWVTWGALPVLWRDKNIRNNQTQGQNLTQGQRIGSKSKINANKLNLRSGPGTDHPVILSFKRGDKVIIRGETQMIDGEVWIKIATSNEQFEGWSLRRFIKP